MENNKKTEQKEISRNQMVEFILDLYKNNPRFITEIITDKSSSDFSDLTVGEVLNTFNNEQLNDIYMQLNFLNND